VGCASVQRTQRKIWMTDTGEGGRRSEHGEELGGDVRNSAAARQGVPGIDHEKRVDNQARIGCRGLECGEDRLGERKDVLHHARDLAREAGARSIGQAEGQLLRVAWQPIQLDPVSLGQSGEDLRRREAHGVPSAGEPCRQGYERFNVAPRTVRDQNNAFGSHPLPPTHSLDAAPAVSLLHTESPVANIRVCSDDECGQMAPDPFECLQSP